MSAERFLAIFETMSLKGQYTNGAFQRLVAARYVLAPASEPRAMALFPLLVTTIQRQHDFLKSKFHLVPTLGDPYDSMKSMTRDINQQRAQGKKPTVPIYAAPPEGGHPALSNDQNVMFRGVHDIMAHYYGQHPFSGRGEYSAYNRHLKTLPPKTALILFTEIVGQTSYYKVYGGYTVQKAAILDDFDPFRVGVLSPGSPLNRYFVLQSKVLRPVPGFKWATFYQEFPDLATELSRQPGFNPQAWENYDVTQDTSSRNVRQQRLVPQP